MLEIVPGEGEIKVVKVGRLEKFQNCSGNQSDELAKPLPQVAALSRLYQARAPTQSGQILLDLVFGGVK